MIPRPWIGTNEAKKDRVITLCKNCGVELILIDEAQHIHDRGRSKSQNKAGDWIKTLIKSLKVPVAFIGPS